MRMSCGPMLSRVLTRIDLPHGSRAVTKSSLWMSLRRPRRSWPGRKRYSALKSPGSTGLLHRHALGQVPWLIDIASPRHRRVVGDELHGDDAEQRLEGFGGIGDVDHVIAVTLDLGITFRRDRDDMSASGADFFDV